MITLSLNQGIKDSKDTTLSHFTNYIATRTLDMSMINSIAVIIALQQLLCANAFAFFPPPSLAHTLEHLFAPPPLQTTLDELTNIRIPGSSTNNEILAYKATPKDKSKQYTTNSIILIHEFFGLNPSIIEKADALSNELGCTVIAPDTFRGEVTSFIPKAIWLAISTPQERVNEDINHVCSYLEKENNGEGKLAVMGFCYGGGKAIRYTTQCNQDAATVVFYGSPVTDVNELKKLKAPVCGIYGSNDAQFPKPLLDKFQIALDQANIVNDVHVYDGVGHAFWKDMEQIERGQQPQTDAYEQCISFLREYFG